MKNIESPKHFPEVLSPYVPLVLVGLQERLATVVAKINAKTENIFQNSLALLTPVVGEELKLPRERVLARYLEELGQDRVEIINGKDSVDGKFKIIVKGANELADYGNNTQTFIFEGNQLIKIEEVDNREGANASLITYITYPDHSSKTPILITKSKEELGKKTMVEWRAGFYAQGDEKSPVVIRRDWDDYFITGQTPNYTSAIRASSLSPGSELRKNFFSFKNPREYIISNDVLRADVLLREYRILVPVESCTPVKLIS